MKRTALLSRSPCPHLHIRDLPAFPAPGHAFPHTHSKLSVLPFLLVRDRKRSPNPDSGRPGGMLQTPSNLPANGPPHGSELAGGRRQEHSPSPQVERRCPSEHPRRGCIHSLPIARPPSTIPTAVSGRRGRAEKKRSCWGPWTPWPLPSFHAAMASWRGWRSRTGTWSDPAPRAGLPSLSREAACVRGPSVEGHGLSRVCRHCDV